MISLSELFFPSRHPLFWWLLHPHLPLAFVRFHLFTLLSLSSARMPWGSCTCRKAPRRAHYLLSDSEDLVCSSLGFGCCHRLRANPF